MEGQPGEDRRRERAWRSAHELEAGSKRGRLRGEFGGAFGDLGTLLPLVLGAITVAGLAPAGVLLGFGVALVGAGSFYGLPMPVQPMKAIAAVILTGNLRARNKTAVQRLSAACLGRVAKVFLQRTTQPEAWGGAVVLQG